MTKISVIILIALILVLSGCIVVNTPDTASLNATVEASVSTAMAPYEEKYGQLISEEELESSQMAQNQKIQQYIVDQISEGKSDSSLDASNDSSSTEMISRTSATATPVGSSASTASSNGSCLDAFTFVSDLTVPDGQIVTPGTIFTKSWYIQNSGTCTWNSKYKIAYDSGNLVGSAKTFSILNDGYYVKPGESIVVSATLIAPEVVNTDYATYWALENDKGEHFGSGAAKNVYLSSKFRVEKTFYLAQNFGAIRCSDNYGYFTCGSSSSDGSRGVVYYDDSPTLESKYSGSPAVVVGPPHIENGYVRIEFGPLRMPRGSWFYANFSCRPDTPTCDVQVRMYVKETGYEERLIQETREWNDGFIGEWKSRLSDVELFEQDFTYIIEVQANGGADDEDLIILQNVSLY